MIHAERVTVTSGISKDTKNEKHSHIGHWKCVETGCFSQFIRRSYLSKHQILSHGYNAFRAREIAVIAQRGDTHKSGYYENISEDDSVFDLIDEIDQIKTNNEQIVDFEFEMGYLDNVRIGYVDDDAVIGDDEVFGDDAVTNEKSVIGDDEVFGDDAVTNDNSVNDDGMVIHDDAVSGDDAVFGDVKVTTDNSVIGDDAVFGDVYGN